MSLEDRWLQPDEALSTVQRCYVCDEPLKEDDDWPPSLVPCRCENDPEVAA